VKLTRSLVIQGVCAAVLLAGCGAIVVRSVSGSPSPPSAPHSVTVPMAQLSVPAVTGTGLSTIAGVTLQTLTGTPDLTIGMANFGLTGALLRVTTPGGSPAPQVRVTDGGAPGDGALVSLSAEKASSITVTLNTAVSWRLNLASGTSRTVADLRGGQVTGVAITAGSDVLDLLLPEPHGSVPIRLAAGASQLLLSVPHGSAVRVTAAKGAGQVLLLGTKHVAVPNGSVFSTPGWAAGATGFDVDATAGAARLTVTARAS
jgi:hypothetical protein